MSRIMSRKFALESARREGLKVVSGSPTCLLLDLDTPEDELWYEQTLPVVTDHIKIVEEKRWRSKNGGLHVQLRSPRPLTVRTRLLIQACLGSDRIKEFLSLIRVWKKEPAPVMLFQPPKKKGTVAWNREVDEPLQRGTEFEYDIDDDVPF